MPPGIFALEADLLQRRDQLLQPPAVLRPHRDRGSPAFAAPRAAACWIAMNWPRVAVVLHVGVGLHDLRVAADEAEPPADHVEALRHRVDLDADVLRPVDLQEAQRLARRSVEQDVGRVLHDDDLVACGRSR